MKINSKKIESLRILIDEANTIGISSHVNPDGDNLGSSLGFARALRNYGKKVDVLGHDEIDDYLKFMPDLEFYSKNWKDSYDLFFILDASDLDRIGESKPVALNSDKTCVIDHHVGANINTDLNIVIDHSPATCELIYEVVSRLNLPIDKDTATLLFTGLVTDTNRFLYQNTSEYTMQVAGKLISCGADREKIYTSLYQSKPIKVMQFENEIISNAIFIDDKVLSVASEKLADKYQVQMGDSESVVNTLRDLAGIDVSMLVKEYGPGEYKVSLRSKNTDVSKIARENGGGGHIKASGFTIQTDSLEKAVKKARAILESIQTN